VPIILTVRKRGSLVETHEKTGKWATIGLEGYGDLTLINMVHKGILGEALHAKAVTCMTCAWSSSLRTTNRGGCSIPIDPKREPVPDHPMSRIMPLLDINHGDRFDYLVSMSTKSVMLNRYAEREYGEKSPYASMKMKQGDVNVTLLHTEGGRMVTLNFDTNTPHRGSSSGCSAPRVYTSRASACRSPGRRGGQPAAPPPGMRMGGRGG